MHKWLLIISLGILLFSCTDKLVVSDFQAIDDGEWHKDSILKFQFTDPDSIQSHNMFINIRNDNTYPYSNLFLIAEISFPDGKSVRDTLEYEMAKPDGEWLGKGYGSIKENKLWYKENIVFPYNGVYTVEVSQAMRRNGNSSGLAVLEGITDVGIQIEKSNE